MSGKEVIPHIFDRFTYGGFIDSATGHSQMKQSIKEIMSI